MNRERRLTIAVAALAMMVAMFFVALSKRQPTYQGRTVNSWLEQVFNAKGNQSQAIDALRELGAKAVPVEIDALARTLSPLDKWYQSVYPKLPLRLRRHLPTPVKGETMHAATIRSAAELALINNEHTREFLPELVRCLKEGNSEVRLYAAPVVTHWIRAEDTFCIPTLIEVLNDGDARVRDYGAHALSRFGPAAKAASPALEKGLKDSETQVRITAAMALSAIDTNTTTLAIPVLKEAIANGDPRTRHWAAVYLRNLNLGDRETIPVFISSLTSQDRDIRISAAYSLLRYGPEAKGATPALVSALNESDAEVRRGVRRALEKIDPEAAAKAEGAHGQDH
jgi:HEAT repeat protein